MCSFKGLYMYYNYIYYTYNTIYFMLVVCNFINRITCWYVRDFLTYITVIHPYYSVSLQSICFGYCITLQGMTIPQFIYLL